MKQILISSLFLLLMTTSCGILLAGDNDPVVFTDSQLKSFIEMKLGVTNPTEADMRTMTDLYLYWWDIKNLTGLEYATSLTELIINDTQISDISPLANLTSLTWLDIGFNEVSDISPLANLTELEYLFIDDNTISDISVLSSMTSLVQLYMDKNNVSDLSALTSIHNLEYLTVRRNPLMVDTFIFTLSEIEDSNPGITINYTSLDGPTLKVLSPNGSEQLWDGRAVEFYWGSINSSEVEIQLSLDSGANWTKIAKVPSNDGQNWFTCHLPKVMAESSNYLMRIIAVEDVSRFDDSDGTFTVSLCNLEDNQGDMNGDCRVDIGDFAVLAENWLVGTE